MRNTLLPFLSAAVFLPFLASCPAQNAQPADHQTSAARTEERQSFRLSFLLKEIDEDGRVTNSRTYSTMIASGKGSASSIRAGSKIPVYDRDKHDVQYIDLGVNVDAHNAEVVGSDLELTVSAEVSSTAAQGSDAPSTPILRQNRWNSSLVIPVNRAVTLFSSDDLKTKGKVQVELTATPIK